MNDDELAARMRATDPAADLDPADPGRVSRLLEDAMTTTDPRPDADRPQTRGPRRSPLTWLAAAAAVVIVAGIGFAVLAQGGDQTKVPTAAGDTVTSLTMPSSAAGRCMVPTPERLAQAQTAFEGTVTSISDGVVTLEATTWYQGRATDLVTVKQYDPGMVDLFGAVQFREGEKYFVAANSGQVMVCGFSGPAAQGDDLGDVDLGKLYSQAFAG